MARVYKFTNGKKMYQLFLHTVLVILAIEVVILTRQNRTLAESASVNATALKIGDTLSLNGLEPLTIFDALDTTSAHLVYLFSIRCGACALNWKSICNVMDVAHKMGVSTIGISIDQNDSTLSYLKSLGLSIHAMTCSDPQEFVAANHISIVPMTVIRSPKGIVMRQWAGVLSEDDVMDLTEVMSKSKPQTIQKEGK